jgi:hypothetical protein
MSDNLQSEEIPHIEVYPPKDPDAKDGSYQACVRAIANICIDIASRRQQESEQGAESVSAGGETQRTVHTVPRLPWKEDNDAPPETQQKEEHTP